MWTLALLLAAAPTAPQDTRVPVPVPPLREGLPQRGLDDGWVVRHHEDEHGVVRVVGRLNHDGHRLLLNWQWFPEWPTAKGRHSSTSRIEFDGVITSFTVLSDGALVLAGEDRGAHPGHTRLERIDLGVEFVDPEQRTITPGEVISRRTLWVGGAPDKLVIAHLARWPGDGPERLVAVLWDEPEVLAFDLASCTWTRVAAARSFGEPGVVQAPDLVRTYYRLSIRDHFRLGHMLMLNTRYGCVTSEKDRILVLADSDRDGVLDRSLLLDEDGWCREGLSSPEHYVR